MALITWSAAWFVPWFFVGMSFIEHFAHRHVMHRKGPVFRLFPGYYERHALLHHGKYYRVFDHEPDPVGRHENITFDLLPSAPIAAAIALPIAWLSPACAIGMVASVLAHHLAWNLAHSEMHIPRGRFFSRWRVYKWMARHHWMHHRHVNRNLNVVCPLADWFWGTWATPSDEERRKMAAAGY